MLSVEERLDRIERHLRTESKFKQGDKVKLKSGGPEMTVMKSNDPTMVSLFWFDKNDAIQTLDAAPYLLAAAKTSPDP